MTNIFLKKYRKLIIYIVCWVVATILLYIILRFLMDTTSKIKNRKYSKDLNYYSDYYEEQEEDFKTFIELLNKYEIKYIAKNFPDNYIENYYEKEVDSTYFYSKKEIEDDIDVMVDFIKKSKIEKVYKFTVEDKIEYRFFILDSEELYIFYDYCSNDCDYQNDEFTITKKKQKYKHSEKRINDQWRVVYHEAY